jgi:hypothetical protein
VTAERDALAGQLQKERGEKRHRLRRLGAAVLAYTACVFLAVAPLAIWARTLVFDTDRWVEVAGPLAEEPAVQDALATKLTDQVVMVVQPAQRLREALPDRADFLAVPLAGALENFVHGRVLTYMQSDDFAERWNTAVRRAHETAIKVLEGDAPNVDVQGDRVTLDLEPMIERVLNRLVARVPSLIGRDVTLPKIDLSQPSSERLQRLEAATGVKLPRDFGQLVVYDHGTLAAAQDALNAFRRLVVLIVALAILLPILALALSPNRRRTGLLLSLGTVFLLVMLRRGILLTRTQLLEDLNGKPAQGAVERLTDRLFGRLFPATAWMVAIGLLVGLVLYLSGPYRGARRIRSATVHAWRRASGAVGAGASRVDTDALVEWVVAHAAVVRVGIAACALVVLWVVDFGWFGTLLVLAALVAGELAVNAVTRSSAAEAAP